MFVGRKGGPALSSLHCYVVRMQTRRKISKQNTMRSAIVTHVQFITNYSKAVQSKILNEVEMGSLTGFIV